MLDKLRELIISKDGIYYIVIPLFTFIVPLIINALSKLKENTHFNFRHKEESSFEKYYIFQLKCMILLYVLVYVLYIIVLFLILIMVENRYTKYIIEIDKYIFSFICIGVYGITIYNFLKEKKENIVKFKRKTKNNRWKYFIFYGAIICQLVILVLSGVTNNKTVNKVEVVIFYMFILGPFIVLDKKSDVKYKYVYLMFEDGTETGAILCEDIKKDGNWLIVYSEQKGEIHYRLKNIKSFRYTYTNRSYIKI